MNHIMGDVDLRMSVLSFASIAAPTVFYFTIYSFFGWVIEGTHSLFTRGTFFKPNFFIGPFKPMYGIAPLLLIGLITENTGRFVTIILCLIIPTIVEYATGVILKTFFHRQWWDYSNHRLQLNGHVCLTYSLAWLGLSYVFIKWIHPAMVAFYIRVEDQWYMIWPFLGLYFLIEMLLANKRHSAKIRVLDTLG